MIRSWAKRECQSIEYQKNGDGLWGRRFCSKTDFGFNYYNLFVTICSWIPSYLIEPLVHWERAVLVIECRVEGLFAWDTR